MTPELAERHSVSHALAQRLYASVSELLQSGEAGPAKYAVLETLYQRYRESGQVVERDAVAEVLDAFEGRCSPDSAL